MFNWEISFDWSWIYDLGSQPLYEIIWRFLINGGWVLFTVTVLFGLWINYVYIMECRYAAKQSYVFLAIDIPRENLQTPRAVENIFSTLSGAHTPKTFYEAKLKGEFQLKFSMEIVSIDGFIQFIVRTPVGLRNLVEASIYSQYPEAEITEVNDYTADINITFPSDEYNLWGADLDLVKPDYYPILTYKEFQEELDREFKDPMAALLEVMSKIGPGEQIWLQLMISPADVGWEKKGLEKVNKTLGTAEPMKKGLLEKIVEAPIVGLVKLGDELMGAVVEPKKEEKPRMMFLPPQQKREVESILEKVDKVCFNSKLRMVYFGKREVFKKGLGASGTFGAIKQFTSSGLNGFKPGKNKTSVVVDPFKKWRVSRRQNMLLKNYKDRNALTGDGPYLLNIEELATLYHFPHIEVRTPLVKRTESRRARAPIGLPVESGGKVFEEAELDPSVAGEARPVIDYDNDYFEDRFAVDKTRQKDRQRKERIIKEIKKTAEKESARVKPRAPAEGNAPENLPFV